MDVIAKENGVVYKGFGIFLLLTEGHEEFISLLAITDVDVRRHSSVDLRWLLERSKDRWTRYFVS